jgi:uncharacterized LabA/DUF88 family protein
VEYYQEQCPSLFKYAGRIVRLSFEFADKLLSANGEPSVADDHPFITHTVATRNTPLYLTKHPDVAPCVIDECEISKVKKWIKKRRACILPSCPHAFDRYFGRTEQKQVDVHLAVDLVIRATTVAVAEHVVVASEDWDLLPAIYACTRYRNPLCLSLVRFRPGGTYLDRALEAAGLRFVRPARKGGGR